MSQENLLWLDEAMAIRRERMGKSPADEAEADRLEAEAEAEAEAADLLASRTEERSP